MHDLEMEIAAAVARREAERQRQEAETYGPEAMERRRAERQRRIAEVFGPDVPALLGMTYMARDLRVDACFTYREQAYTLRDEDHGNYTLCWGEHRRAGRAVIVQNYGDPALSRDRLLCGLHDLAVRFEGKDGL